MSGSPSNATTVLAILLFDRCDVLAGDLEIRLGALEHRARRKIGDDQRFLAVIFALVKGSRIPGRL